MWYLVRVRVRVRVIINYRFMAFSGTGVMYKLSIMLIYLFFSRFYTTLKLLSEHRDVWERYPTIEESCATMFPMPPNGCVTIHINV